MRIFGGLLVTACLMGPVQALEFQNACKAGKQIVIGAVGDFLLHAAMQDKGCLLYTSPSPRDLSTSRMPSSA